MWTLCNIGFVTWLDAVLLRNMNAYPDHSVINNKMHRGDHLPQCCATLQGDWNGKRGPQSASGQSWCLFCWITWSPHNFGFVAWLDEALLRFVNSDPDHSVIDNKTHRGDCLSQSYNSPVRGQGYPALIVSSWTGQRAKVLSNYHPCITTILWDNQQPFTGSRIGFLRFRSRIGFLCKGCANCFALRLKG